MREAEGCRTIFPSPRLLMVGVFNPYTRQASRCGSVRSDHDDMRELNFERILAWKLVLGFTGLTR